MHKSWKLQTVIFLIIQSILLFTSLLFIPFIDYDGKTLMIVSTVLIVLGEITVWLGGILLGKELFTNYQIQIIFQSGKLV